MIIARIIGGLGNQLFQYACARALSTLHRVPLKLDVRGFQSYKLHQYQLNNFNVAAEPAADDELPQSLRYGPFAITLQPKRKPSSKLIIVHEQGLGFNSQVSTLGSNLYLDGYWQSEKYFHGIRELLLQDLQLHEPIDIENHRLLQTMQKCEAVALHVRRGDYVQNPAYATCSPSYYHNALAQISERAPKAHVFVFSDDMKWVERHLQFRLPTTYVTLNNGRTNYKDLLLMTYCKHSVIANSSFSWWGAWLKRVQPGLVVAPQAWYTEVAKDTRDLIPTGWTTIPNGS